MTSIQKREAEKILFEETLVKKKLNSQGSHVNLQNIDKTNEFPKVSITPPLSSEINTETKLKQGESPLKNKKGPKKQEKSSYEEIHNAYLNDPNSFIDTNKVVKYKGNSYHIEDKLLIRNEADTNNDFIGKLLRIIRLHPT